MTDNTQPEALYLADWLEAVGGGPSAKRCAALLREQHARIAELEAQLPSSGFTAADMATASAQGFRDGVASVAASAPAPSAHIKEPYTLAEIKAKIANNDYSAELLLQHALLLLDGALSQQVRGVSQWRGSTKAATGFEVFAAAGLRRLHAENERLAAMVEAQQPAPTPQADSVTAPAAYSGNLEQELAMLIRRIVSSARRNCEDGSNVLKLANEAWAYLVRKGLNGSPLRDAGIESDPTPAAQAADSVLEDAGGANWQDISTAPKDGTRFVAVGNNYGLYSEGQHTCIAQWFRGCWMDVSEWNETSELKYLTHWMPLLPLPGTAARKQGANHD